MAIQTLTLGGKRFVVVPEKDFRLLERRAESKTRSDGRSSPARQRLEADRDLADAFLARKRLRDPKEKPMKYEAVRKELGLA